MPAATILVEALPGDIRIASVVAGRLVGFTVDDGTGAAGDIRLGRVGRLHDGLQAAFVDVGLARDGFLALSEARPPAKAPGRDRIGDYVSEGDAVLVEVLRDPLDDKGAKLTRDVTIAGRLLVFTPSQPGVRLSKRIAGEAARGRVREALSGNLTDREGVVARSLAATAEPAALVAELERLSAAWTEVDEAVRAARAPALIRRGPDALARLILDDGGAERIVVDDADTARRLRDLAAAWAPELAARIEWYRGPGDLFAAEGVADQIEALFQPRVPLPSGGSLIIEETAALVAIDVNSGGRSEGAAEETAHRVNLEAAAEVARQVALRDLGGTIVVDFLTARAKRRRMEVVAALRAAVAADPMPVNVFGFTPLGLVEMTRQRQRRSLSGTLGAACPACAGSGTTPSPRAAAMAALRAMLAAARSRPGSRPSLRAGGAVLDALAGEAAPARRAVEERLGTVLVVARDDGLGPCGYAIDES